MNIDTLLIQARELGASDLHITVGLAVMIRLGGSLTPLNESVLDKNDCYDLLLPMLSKENLEKLKNNIDADFSYTTSTNMRHRVNMYKQRGALSCAIRLLRDDIPSLADLGLPSTLYEMAMLPRGLILVTGPAGSGKSTTLAAMIDAINTDKSHHIIT
ncbi:MAG: ATPase, T2SS/T4P/T4SS family, partial [Oscillospiraceae bacterium]